MKEGNQATDHEERLNVIEAVLFRDKTARVAIDEEMLEHYRRLAEKVQAASRDPVISDKIPAGTDLHRVPEILAAALKRAKRTIEDYKHILAIVRLRVEDSAPRAQILDECDEFARLMIMTSDLMVPDYRCDYAFDGIRCNQQQGHAGEHKAFSVALLTAIDNAIAWTKR